MLFCARSALDKLRSPARLLGVALLATGCASARDAYVILSGGGTPLSNNYSQFLQARGMSADLQRSRPADSVWIFFGAGNRPGEPARLADVHRQVKEGRLLRDTWLPGALPRNRPATKAEFLRALREEILPCVRDGGTLYLFIGDHGARTTTEPNESVITLWQMVKRNGTDGGWNTDAAEALRVSELRAALVAGLGRGRVIFCMTQCYSGGFQDLGVPKVIDPPPNWFRTLPTWAARLEAPPLPALAGFTSVDGNSMAAGCDPDPDPDRWSGYERFFPEALLGIDLFDGRKTGPRQSSYAAAHEAAVMVDQTIDTPRSSSEQYLERWAVLIERLAAEPTLTRAARSQVEIYRHAVNHGLAIASDPEFAAMRDRFARFVTRMCEQNQSAASLLQSGTQADLERAIASRTRTGRTAAPDGTRLWNEVLRPAWKHAVKAGQVTELSGPALAFENYLLAREDKGQDLMARKSGQNPMLNDLYWESGYAVPARLDAGKAEAVTRWGAARAGKIVEWARNSGDPSLHAAAERLAPAWLSLSADDLGPARTLRREIAAGRTLFYRRVLAAWAFLLAMSEQPALARLQEYIELERAPLPLR